jgi:hypothetical protein
LKSICIPGSIDRSGWFCFMKCDDLSEVRVGDEWQVCKLDGHDYPIVTRVATGSLLGTRSESCALLGCLYLG